MAIERNRRMILAFTAALTAGAALPPWLAAAPKRARSDGDLGGADFWPRLLGSWEHDGVREAGLWTAADGGRGVTLPSRAHGILADPGNRDQVIVIARRPGDYLMRFDARDGSGAIREQPGAHRVLNGHAAFSDDSGTLYTTENDVHDGSGVIGVRDAATLVKHAEFPTHGNDPHALLVEPDGTLLVANGGVLTLPDTGRVKLALERMDPSLVRLDGRDGRLLGQWRLPDPRLSIRHLARAPGGRVGIALQAEHERSEQRQNAPVFAWFDGQSVHLPHAPPSIELGGYGGDAACVVEQGQTYFVVSCSRAGFISWWDDEGQWRGAIPMRNPCALLSLGNALFAASEDGELACIASLRTKSIAVRATGLQWDNHLAA